MRIYKTRADFVKLQDAQNPNVFAGTVCTITDEALNPMYVFQGGVWNNTVTAITNPITGGLIFSKKRDMYLQNRADPVQSYGKVQTNGTITDIAGDPRTIISTATATACRAFASPVFYNLDPTKFYQASFNVDGVSLANPGNKVQPWMTVNEAVTSGTKTLLWATPPVAGQRFGINFQPSGTTATLRLGFGTDGAENNNAGDFIQFSSVVFSEVPSLSHPIQDYSSSTISPVGIAQTDPASIGSCIYVIGDSWSNDIPGAANGAEWPYVLGNTYGREFIGTTLAGYRLDEIRTGVETRMALGLAGLNLPNRNAPGVWVVAGGINDVLQDTAGATVFTRAKWFVTEARKHGAIPLVVIQPLASDYVSYNAPRMAARAAYVAALKSEGVDYIDLQTTALINGDGTASVTLMAADKLHPAAGGSVLVADLIEAAIRNIERGTAFLPTQPVWP